MTEWSSADPDAPRVFYDLALWDFEQQAELTSALAEAEIPHGWEGTELIVPEESEAATDAIFAEIEVRLGIPAADETDDDEAGDESPEEDGDDEIGERPPLREISADETVTEYDLGDWQELERNLVADSLASAAIPSRWEASVLLVPTADEEIVEQILDDVESGEIVPVIQDGPEGDQLPFESLNSFFLAGERLRKNAGDADGLERLLEALKIADPNRPPRGVELRVWRRTCELAEELADALVADEEDPDSIVAASADVDDDDDDGEDVSVAMQIASDLHDLLRPLI